MTPGIIRELIAKKIPGGTVVPRHTSKGHFYEVVPVGKTFPSVTAKLQVLKDEGLINYKMNRAVEYCFAHYKEFNDDNITEHLDRATRVSQDILEDAGDIGTRIHGYREDYFNAWIASGVRPAETRSFIPNTETDQRATSAMRALQKFVLENDYVPVLSELLVYDVDLALAGTLDDLGIMRKVLREGKQGCEHDTSLYDVSARGGVPDKETVGAKYRCWKCDYKYTYEYVLLDIKTSNQFKNHYFFQVAIYYMMVSKLTGLKPTRCFILKLSKEDGTYKIEELYELGKLVRYAKHMLKTNEAIDFITSLRKDNQKVVGKEIIL